MQTETYQIKYTIGGRLHIAYKRDEHFAEFLKILATFYTRGTVSNIQIEKIN